MTPIEVIALVSASVKALLDLIHAISDAYDLPADQVRMEAMKAIASSDSSATDLCEKIQDELP